MNIKVGQIWKTWSREIIDTEWRFEVIKKVTYRNQIIWIARKLGVKPDALQIRFFDRKGEEIDDQNFGLGFFFAEQEKP